MPNAALTFLIRMRQVPRNLDYGVIKIEIEIISHQEIKERSEFATAEQELFRLESTQEGNYNEMTSCFLRPWSHVAGLKDPLGS